MRKRLSIWCAVLVVAAAVSVTAQDPSKDVSKTAPPLGMWSGSWEGAGSGGGFELTFEQAKDGPLTGAVAVTGEPAYKATLRAITFDGKKLGAKYDFPPDESAEVVLAGTVEGVKASGTWSLSAKGSDNAVASGTWTVTRK